MFNRGEHNHKFAFVCMVMSWCKLNKRTYFERCRLTVQVAAETLGCSVVQCLGFRGWTMHYDANDRPVCECRKLRYLLLQMEQAGKFIELFAMIIRIVRQIQDDRLMSQAVEAREARSVRDRITRHTHAHHTAHFAFKHALAMIVEEKGKEMTDEKFADTLSEVFSSARTRKDVIKSCHTLLLAFPDHDTVLNLNCLQLLRDSLRENPSGFVNQVISKLDPLSLDNQDRRKDCLSKLLEQLRFKFGPKKTTSRNRFSTADCLKIVRFKIHHECFVLHPEKRPPFWPSNSPPKHHVPPLPQSRRKRRRRTNAAAGNAAQPAPRPSDAPGVSLSSLFANVGNATTGYNGLVPRDESEKAVLFQDPIKTKPGPVGHGEDGSIATMVPSGPLSPATFGDVRKCHGGPVVHVKAHFETLLARLLRFEVSPGEFHSISDLGTHPHGMNFDRSHPQFVSLTDVPMSASHLEPSFVVVRFTNQIWKRHFDKLQVDIEGLVAWVHEQAVQDAARDSGGSRVDFGCCGQSWLKDSSGSDCWCPNPLVGMNQFPSNKPHLRKDIGLILDAMQGCMDDVCDATRSSRCFQNEGRDELFAAKFREALSADSFRFEWCTLQLKNLTRGDLTKEHVDSFNCGMKDYDRTTSFCVVLRDQLGTLWSLKVIGNSRKVAGNFVRSKLLTSPGAERQIPLDSLTLLCQTYALRVQSTYNSLMDEYDGAWPGEELDWRFPERSLLLEGMNWTTGMSGHDGHNCKCVTTAASISRDFWLSPAAHWVNKWVLKGRG